MCPAAGQRRVQGAVCEQHDPQPVLHSGRALEGFPGILEPDRPFASGDAGGEEEMKEDPNELEVQRRLHCVNRAATSVVPPSYAWERNRWRSVLPRDEPQCWRLTTGLFRARRVGREDKGR